MRITLVNENTQPHTLHFHGIVSVAQMNDGVPHVWLQVMPGQSHTYEFVAANPGTHAYHCHVDTFRHHDYGTYGAIIIEPKEERVVWDRDYSLILDEWDSRQTSRNAVHDQENDYFLINGKTFPSVPDLEIGEGKVALLRFVNMGFEQPVILVKAGSTVTWTKGDEAPHTVTSSRPGDAPDTRAFDSTGMADGGMQMMMQGDTWS